MVREVLERDLSRLECARHVGQEAADPRAGRLHSVPFDEVEAELGLSGEAIRADALSDVERAGVSNARRRQRGG